jgi:hypothetical protein
VRNKAKKTEAQLTAMIMSALRGKHECGNITDVVIRSPPITAQDQPNWVFDFVRKGAESSPPICDTIAREIQNQFELE